MSMEENKRASLFDTYIEKRIIKVLEKMKVLNNQWHLGVVDEILSPSKLKVFVDGSDISQTVTCNPDVNFAVGDHVRVIFINGNPRDKFVLCKRNVV